LIFYITQNDLELDAGKVESIYSRLTTASLSTYLADVKVHSAVRGNVTEEISFITTKLKSFTIVVIGILL